MVVRITRKKKEDECEVGPKGLSPLSRPFIHITNIRKWNEYDPFY